MKKFSEITSFAVALAVFVATSFGNCMAVIFVKANLVANAPPDTAEEIVHLGYHNNFPLLMLALALLQLFLLIRGRRMGALLLSIMAAAVTAAGPFIHSLVLYPLGGGLGRTEIEFTPWGNAVLIVAVVISVLHIIGTMDNVVKKRRSTNIPDTLLEEAEQTE